MNAKETAVKIAVAVLCGELLDISKEVIDSNDENTLMRARVILFSYPTLKTKNERLLKAIKKHIEDCGSCGGTGTAHTCIEEDVGMPPGSSGLPCPECFDIRAVIAKETTP